MNGKIKAALAVGALLLCGSGALWWFTNMERAVVLHWAPSDAATENPMLAATRLLQQHGRKVQVVGTLDELPLATLADGVVLMANTHGMTTARQAGLVQAWVERGNVLVTQPRRLGSKEEAVATADAPDGEEDNEEDREEQPAPAKAASRPKGPAPLAPLDEADPLAVRLGVRTTYAQGLTARCDERARPLKSEPEEGTWSRLACLAMPASGAVLEADTRRTILVTVAGGATPTWQDARAEALRSYPQGKGQVVMLAANYFHNQVLYDFDHGELLLALAKMQPRGPFYIVQRLGIAPWYVTLWKNFSPLLLVLAALLCAALWMALRRFGPLLPPARQERRSLMEHISASGKWLWQTDSGREQLLAAVRSATLETVQRRVPGLAGKSMPRQLAMLAELSGIAEARLEQALHTRASNKPQEFTRQIRTLEELRKLYERH